MHIYIYIYMPVYMCICTKKKKIRKWENVYFPQKKQFANLFFITTDI